MSGSVQDRFSAKVSPEPMSGCWLWTGSFRRDGYGSLSIDGVTHAAHRVSWWLSKGEIHDGLCVLHRCDNRACVNPDHLWLGTKRDNTNDMLRKGRTGYRKNRAATACPAGHPYNEQNTYTWRGKRACRACGLIRYHARRRAASAQIPAP